MNYKVSVIIPVYNAENTLKNSIDSLINQTFGFNNIEVIIIDDKSNDNSKEIIKELSNNYKNIKAIFSKKGSGFPGKPRNIGINEATANYIIFLDADDEYLPESIELLYNTILKEDSDFVMGTHIHSINNRQFQTKLFSNSKGKISLDPHIQENFDNISKVRFVAPWGKIFKKELILDNNMFFLEDCLCEDSYFYYNALINSRKVTYLADSAVYQYKTNPDSAIHGHDLKKFNDFFNGLKEVKTLLSDFKLNEIVAISEHVESLLLIFSNLTKEDKNKVINEIYHFEHDLDYDLIIHKKEINFLNNLIFNKHFKLAISVATIYKQLYNNEQIKHFYRLLINKNK